jgi:hypothetical protein
MYNILAPVLAVYATLRVWGGALAERRFAAALGLVVGLGLTAYPVFAVVAICCVPPALYRMWREPSVTRRRRTVVNGALLLALTILPSLLWYLFVRATTGDFFQFELAQGEVVWMADAWAKGAGVFLHAWFAKAWKLVGMAPQVVPVGVLAALVAWFAFRRRSALAPAYPVMVAALYVSAAMFGFYTCVGWTVERLAYPIVPPLLLGVAAAAMAVARQLNEAGRRRFALATAALAVAQAVYVVAKDGPWS